MSSAKIAVSLDPEVLKQVDQLVEGGLFPSRSKLIQDAVAREAAASAAGSPRPRMCQAPAPGRNRLRWKSSSVVRLNGPSTERHIF
ncbi:MAG TPA: ribbon-helix-helix domain-containing protein [Thermoanaerobaculia bacterium]